MSDGAATKGVSLTDLNANLPKGKQTVLGLYATSWEAYEKWRADPDKARTCRNPNSS